MNLTPRQWKEKDRIEGIQFDADVWKECLAVNALLGQALIELKISNRKLRLFGCACCRLVWNYMPHPESRAAVIAAEQFSAGLISEEEMQAAGRVAEKRVPSGGVRWLEGMSREELVAYQRNLAAVAAREVAAGDDEGGWPYWERIVDLPGHVTSIAIESSGELNQDEMEIAMCDLLREISGNPFQPVQWRPEWRTEDVMRHANEMYQTGDFEHMPQLAAALRKAGCDSDAVMSHVSQTAPHARGCWVIDSLIDPSS